MPLTIADGWTITDDPPRISFGSRDLYVDLGADEQTTLGRKRKSSELPLRFRVFSTVPSYIIWKEAMWDNTRSIERSSRDPDPDRLLYLAVPRYTFETILAEKFGQLIVSELHLRSWCSMTSKRG